MDKLQDSFLKHIFGVHQRSSNWAVRSETNRNSVLIKIINRMIGFWNHLNHSESPITQDTLVLAQKLHNEGITSWFTSIVKMADIVGIHHNNFEVSKSLTDQNLKKVLNKLWYNNNKQEMRAFYQSRFMLRSHQKNRPCNLL